MDKTLIYLDHAAATPVDTKVLDSMQPYFSDRFFNPSSPYAPAVEVRHDYENAKHKLAMMIGAKPGEITITAGATESINLALNVTGHIVTTSVEHHAVLAAADLHDNTKVSVDKYGRVSPDAIRSAIRPDTQLISVALANNELGTIQPIRDIAEVVKNERATRFSSGDTTPIYLHCDASQGANQLDVNVARLGVDMLTLNAGKIYGPKQVGMLWSASYVKINPQIVGGGQERGLRSGTENVAGVIGFAKALEMASSHRKFESDRLLAMRNQLRDILTTAFPDAVVAGHPKHQLSGYLHISFPGLDGERLIFLLESKGVLVASGSACAANKGLRSHVLGAIGMPDEVADGSIRVTLGHLNTPENIEAAGQIMVEQISAEYDRTRK